MEQGQTFLAKAFHDIVSQHLFVHVLDSSSNSVLCLESFMTSIHEKASTSPTDSAVAATPSPYPAGKRRASDASKRNVKTPRTSQKLFKCRQFKNEKLSLEMTANITDDANVTREYKALAPRCRRGSCSRQSQY
jgi:hypothetical protein